MNPSLMAVAFGALLGVSVSAAAVGGKAASAMPAEAAAVVPEKARDRFRDATRLAEAGKVDQAIAVLRELISEYPRQPEPYNNLAALYARQGRLDQAKEVLERAIRTDESYATVYENLSTVYVEMARDSYVKALRIEEPRNTPRLQLLQALNTTPFTQGAGDEPQVVAAASAASEDETGQPEPEKPEPEKPEPEKPEPEKPEPEKPEPEKPEPEKPEPEKAEPEKAEPEKAEPEKAEPEKAEPGKPAEGPTQVAEAGPEETTGDKGPPQAALAMLRQWARAWSEQDVEAYLDFYASDFQPDSGRAREQWAEVRRERIRRPAWIEVRLEDFDFSRRDPDRLEVKLMQHYEASNYQDKTVKRFVLVRRQAGWKIRSEQSLKTIR